MQHTIATQESSFAGTVFTYQQRNWINAAALFALKTTYILQN